MATVVSPTSIMVTWDMVSPLDQNGVITMYEVLYIPKEIFDVVLDPRTMNVSTTSALLDDLQEFVNYTISVRAYTNAGEGPYSGGVSVITTEDGI